MCWRYLLESPGWGNADAQNMIPEVLKFNYLGATVTEMWLLHVQKTIVKIMQPVHNLQTINFYDIDRGSNSMATMLTWIYSYGLIEN